MANQVRLEGQHRGAALQAFVLALGQSPAAQRVLKKEGLVRIEPDKWYDINLARTIYHNLLEQVGERTVYQAGFTMIEGALGPSASAVLHDLRDVRSLLLGLESIYRRFTRGPHIGDFTVEFDEGRCATIVCTTALPCALLRGIIQGSVRKFAPTALVEHGEGDCQDRGAATCTYFLNW
jgi:hypothetical protein